jgi:ribosomal protein S18 acetylase RimI-like enzyme
VTAPFRLEALEEHHDRSAFGCGEEALDRYFKTQVTQDIRRRLANCFVAVETQHDVVAGFYTLAAASIPMPDLPQELVKRLPRYPSLPAARIGRLAVDMRFHGRGLGGALLADAAQRALPAATAAYALLVDAKNDTVAKFYEHHGFQRLVSQPRTLFLPLATAEKALRKPRTR